MKLILELSTAVISLKATSWTCKDFKTFKRVNAFDFTALFTITIFFCREIRGSFVIFTAFFEIV